MPDDDKTTWTISIDTGGTFTDAVGRCSDGTVAVAKVPSTPDDPSRGLADAIAALVDSGVPREDISIVAHGTTIATNAVLTSSLARVSLVTTEGFRDVLAYRNGSRPEVYSLTPERPHELVPRERRFEVRERIASTGEIVVPLTDAEVDRVVAEVVASQPEAVSVCLLFGFLDDRHEQRLGDALRAALPSVPVSLASEVAREFREYPRMSTTTINAALRPLVSGYLRRALDAIERESSGDGLLVMQSNGGCAPADRADREAHRLILSGPAGGVAALVALGDANGVPNAISIDMGGTSTDVCLVREGRVPLATSQQVRDHILLAPTVDIHTIGAGGGSIAWVDETGRLRVGPMSAKAVPGPVSYGRGGTEPTLTDAHVVLGTLGSVALASGLQLDRALAVQALARLAERAGIGGDDEETKAVAAAHSVIAISVAHMVRALRTVSIERGLDPREFTLVPFGGAGPLHAGLLLRHLRLRDAVIPRRPGLFSAEGLLAAGLRLDDAQTVLRTMSGAGAADRDAAFMEMASAWFADHGEALRDQLVADGVAHDDVVLTPMADCRYLGQGYELPVELPGLTAVDIAALPSLFHTLHEERYGHCSKEEEVEVVTLRLAAVGAMPAASVTPLPRGGVDPASEALLDTRSVTVPGASASQVPVWDRDLLTAGNVLLGPALIHQMDATTLILEGQRAVVLDSGDVRVEEVQ